MKNGSDSSNTFWPGYVDAISTLVLNLLFIVCIFALAVFVLGVEASKKEMTKATTVEPELQMQQHKMVLSEQAANKAITRNVERVTVKKMRDVDCFNISVQFQEDGFAMSLLERQELGKRAKQLNEAKCDDIQITGYADVTRSLAKRIAFLRVMSVREALIEIGIDASIIEVKIVDANDESGNGRVVTIEGARK